MRRFARGPSRIDGRPEVQSGGVVESSLECRRSRLGVRHDALCSWLPFVRKGCFHGSRSSVRSAYNQLQRRSQSHTYVGSSPGAMSSDVSTIPPWPSWRPLSGGCREELPHPSSPNLRRIEQGSREDVFEVRRGWAPGRFALASLVFRMAVSEFAAPRRSVGCPRDSIVGPIASMAPVLDKVRALRGRIRPDCPTSLVRLRARPPECPCPTLMIVLFRVCPPAPIPDQVAVQAYMDGYVFVLSDLLPLVLQGPDVAMRSCACPGVRCGCGRA